jgi:hypothetical protein
VQLLEVVLEPAAPVGCHRTLLLGEDLQDLLRLVLADAGAEADLVGGIGGNEHREIAVDDTKDEVLLLLAQELFLANLFDYRGPMFGVHDRVAFPERHEPSRWKNGSCAISAVTSQQGSTENLPAQSKCAGQRRYQAVAMPRTTYDARRSRAVPAGESAHPSASPI